MKIIETGQLYPLKFRPVYMERLWGGDMLSGVLHRELPEHENPIGESWDLADRDEVSSVVFNGALAGATLHELVVAYRASLLGTRAAGAERFPLIVKVIDAGERLSLQVHPDELACRDLGGGAEPKTEMWYVLAAKSGAKIFAGLDGRATRIQLLDMIDSPDIERLMQVYHSSPCDAYYIAAGTLHAIGAGNLILEIQQNSDTTYRMNDWGRLGPDGKPRTLHKEQAIRSVNFTNRTNPRVPSAVGTRNFNRKFDVVKLCPFFQVADLRLHSTWNDDTGAGESFHLLSAVRNRVRVGRDDRTAEIIPGETLLIPACFGPYEITPLDPGEATVVRTTL